MLGKFKNDQLFVEKAKPEKKFYVENLNHLSWNKSAANYLQEVSLKIAKENECFNFQLFMDIGRILELSKDCWKNKTWKPFVCWKLEFQWQ